MVNFSRALRVALKQRWTFVGTVVFSFLVAVLWGANIGALYPVIQVAFQGRSLQSWLDEEIARSQQQVVELEAALVDLRTERESAAPEARGPIQKKLRNTTFDLQVENRVLATRQAIRPWLYWLLPEDPFRTVVAIVGMLVGATFVKGLFMFCNAMCVARIEMRLLYELRRQFYHQALRMDMSAFGEERTSGLLSRFNTEITTLAGGVKNLFGSAIREPMKMLACLIGASLISWRLLLFSLLFSPIVAYLIRRLAGSIRRANRRVLEEIRQLYGVLTETFNGIQTVQAYTLEQRERQKFHRVAKECLQKGMRIATYGALTKPITEVMGITMISLALVAGAYLALNQQTHLWGIRLCDRPLDVPSLLVFYGLLIGTTEPARKLSEIFNSIQGGIAAADRLYPVLDREPTIQSPPDPRPIPACHRRVVFDNVSFHYEPGTPVLREINLSVDFGETIAIVGPNGCGKSTLLQLLPRFFDPISGAVRLDDVDLRDVRLRDLRQKIGVVSQQALLFDDTVYNNILCGRPDASPAEVYDAARQARADRFVLEKLSDGYETIVGANGGRLSGGQRQRIALARAILRDPEILILDEATSQVDLESEQLIHQALRELAEGRTVFLITHRMAAISLADRVVVMNAGVIEDVGSHDELVRRCALYQRLASIQFKQSA